MCKGATTPVVMAEYVKETAGPSFVEDVVSTIGDIFGLECDAPTDDPKV